MNITQTGNTKLETSGSASAINISGDAGGGTLQLGYHDGVEVVPYATVDAVDVGTQHQVPHGVDVEVYLMIDGGTAIDINVIVGRLNQYL